MSDVHDLFEPHLTGNKKKRGHEEINPRHYIAYKPVDRRQLRLAVRPASGSWERINYRFLLRIIENSDKGTEMTLVFTFMAVQVTGRNLRPVAHAIDKEMCVYLQAFDPLRFDHPVDDTAPFIDKITIVSAPIAGLEET